MRRDWELIRLLLLRLSSVDVDLSPWTERQEAYHRYLLVDGGLANGGVKFKAEGVDASISRISDEGYKFLSWASDGEMWDKVMSYIEDRNLPKTKAMLDAVSEYHVARDMGVDYANS